MNYPSLRLIPPILKVDDTRFRVHGHFLSTHSFVFRSILQRNQDSSSTSDNKSSDGTCPARRAIRRKGVTVLSSKHCSPSMKGMSVVALWGNVQAPTQMSLSWKQGFSMPISNWVAPLSIAHRFKFTDVESRARRDVFRCSPLDPVKQIFLAEQLSVPTSSCDVVSPFSKRSLRICLAR